MKKIFVLFYIIISLFLPKHRVIDQYQYNLVDDSRVIVIETYYSYRGKDCYGNLFKLIEELPDDLGYYSIVKLMDGDEVVDTQIYGVLKEKHPSSKVDYVAKKMGRGLVYRIEEDFNVKIDR